jgi:cytochrome c peroxidase
MLFRLLALLCLTAPLGAAELTVAFEPRWLGVPLAVPSNEVRNTQGQALRITRIAALVSGFGLVRADGTSVRTDGQYGFIDAAQGRLAVTLRGVPDGDYIGLEFQIGLPPAVNHADSGQWPAGHVLNPLVNGLHWSWQGGYVFLALEGRWRDASAGAAAERGFSYHLATDARLMTLRFVSNFRVERATTVQLALDFARVLTPQPLAADDGSETTHSGANDELAPRLAKAVERAGFLLEARPALVAADVRRPESAEGKRAGLATSAATTPLAFDVPAGFPQPELPVDNALTADGVALGKALFHDRRLSGNGAQSCASCHAPAHAFGDTVAFSLGAEGRPGARNAMPLFNLAWNPSYAWDGSQPRIRDQALAAMTNPIEMHGEPARVVAALAKDESVRAQFAAAFGSPEISADRIGRALEQYLLTLVSADSKFDRALRGQAELTESEKRGFDLFLTEYDPARGKRGADCFHCHGGALLTDYGFKNNGLDLVSRDEGRSRVTQQAGDRGKFKTPSLRNVALTAPYMHDGRFATLEDVVAHYDHGVQRSAPLDPNLAKHPDAGLKLTEQEQRDLAAFLRTLTDEKFGVAPASSPALAGVPSGSRRYSSPSQ